MKLFPCAMCRSAYDIDYGYLWRKGCRGLIFDIDNTLVEHNEPATDRAVKFVGRLRDIGFAVSVVSNNKEPRVKAFADAVGCLYVYKAGKPRADGYVKAMEMMKTDRDNTICVGDQLFTDMWGANNADIRGIMTHRMASHEEIQIHFKRIPETLLVLIFKITHIGRGKVEDLYG